MVNDNKHIKFKVEKGMENGDTIMLDKEAEQVPDLGRGDLIFTMKQKPHKTFRRVGRNLYADVELTLEEALLGFQRDIVHLDGHVVRVKPKAN